MTQDASGQAGSVKIVDALGIRATVRDLSGNDALNVALVDASGNQITTFGGVSMTDDAAFTPAVSSVNVAGFVFDDTVPDSVDEGDAGAARMSANRNQYVTIRDSAGNERGVTVDVSNQLSTVDTAVKTAVEIMDDWDETDRAKVNIIVGQAGVAAGTGVDGVTVPRVTLATNVALPAGTNNIGDVDVLTVPAPLSTTGGGTEATALRVTVASDSTGVLSVDDNGGSLTVDGSVSVSGAVDTELTTADLDTGVGTDTRAVVGLVGTASGGGALIPGSATDGLLVNLGANNDVGLNAGVNNIGDVDVLSVPAPLSTTGGGTEATALRVTVANDSTGVLSVDDNGGALTVDNGGTFAVQATIAAGAAAIAKAEDVASADADVGVPAMAVRKATPANTSGLDGDYEMLQMSAGRLWVDPSGVTLTVGSHAVTNAGTFAVQADSVIPGTGATNLGKAEDAAHTTGDVGVMALGIRDDTLSVFSGAENDYEPFHMTAAGRLYTSATIDAALPAGTNAIGKLAANSGVDIGDVDVLTLPNVTLAAGTNTNEFVGDAAHDAAIAGNPVRIGGRALTADYTAVAAGDTADFITTLTGKQVVYPWANPNQNWSYAAPAGGLVTTTAVTIKAAAGAGIRNYITDIQVVNSHATTSTELTINDGAAGTVLWRGWLQAAGGGYSIHFNTPLRGTANTLLEIDEITATGTAGVLFDCQGFTAAE